MLTRSKILPPSPRLEFSRFSTSDINQSAVPKFIRLCPILVPRSLVPLSFSQRTDIYGTSNAFIAQINDPLALGSMIMKQTSVSGTGMVGARWVRLSVRRLWDMPSVQAVIYNGHQCCTVLLQVLSIPELFMKSYRDVGLQQVEEEGPHQT